MPQLAVSLIGPMNVTRAVLPVMRNQRCGSYDLHLIVGRDRRWFRLRVPPTPRRSSGSRDGWSRFTPRWRRLASITVVNPGFFRTELLTDHSTSYADPSISDYDDRRGPLIDYWKSQNGQQAGDPAKLARALITIASQEPPPRRFIAGADAIGTAEQKVAELGSTSSRTGSFRLRWPLMTSSQSEQP